MSKAAARLIPEAKFKKFLEALVHQEHIPVSDIERTGAGEHRVFVLGKPVIIPIKHHGEKGIKEPYLGRVIDAAALKYGPVGSPQYEAGRKEIKKRLRETLWQ